MSWLTHWVPSLSWHHCSSTSPETLHKSEGTSLAQSISERKNMQLSLVFFYIHSLSLLSPSLWTSRALFLLIAVFFWFFFFFFFYWRNWKAAAGRQAIGFMCCPAGNYRDKQGRKSKHTGLQQSLNVYGARLAQSCSTCPRPRWRFWQLARSASSASQASRHGGLEISSSVKGEAYRRQK